jgi:hypothetical protein
MAKKSPELVAAADNHVDAAIAALDKNSLASPLILPKVGFARFVDQIVIVGDAGSFSDSGDSGSLIVDRASKRATGSLFAGSSTHTIANPIDEVLTALGVTVLV